MAIPLKYNFRNLLRRKIRTVLTVLGIALVVFVEVFTLSFATGLMNNIRNNGDPDNVIVLSAKAGTTIWFSEIAGSEADALKSNLDNLKPPIEGYEDDEGEWHEEIPYWSPEVNYMTDIENFPENRLVTVRGIDPKTAFIVNTQVRVAEGEGPFDDYSIVVGPLVAAKLGVPDEMLKIGKFIRFKEQDWTITGRLSAPGTMMESEIWCHHDNLMEKFDRTTYAAVKIKAKRTDLVPALMKEIKRKQRFKELEAYHEPDFYKGYADQFNKFTVMALITAIVIAIGGVFTGINTMYTAVVGRIREIGMLQVIGFSKRAVVSSFLAESLMISLIGGIIGCTAGYMLINGAVFSLSWFAFKLNVTMPILAVGFATAFFIGLIGALFPALRGVQMRMVDAMRYN
ncbi:MAG: ABC transporter permease [Planctomycetota bacterium]|jgi:putative ABC transport system permease protein